jgi:hypothetical protein
VKDPLNYSLGDQQIHEASCCKYLGIIIRSDLSWGDQVNYMVQKAWRALHFVTRIVRRKKGKQKYENLAYTSLARPILEYGAACWGPYRECQISALDSVKKPYQILRIFREAQPRNLWRSVGRSHACVRSTKRIPVTGHGKR